MLQYLVILLDDTSIAYCHASNPMKSKKLIDKEVLKEAIVFGMKNNLMIQYVLPPYELPQDYGDIIESIDNLKIGEDIKVYDSIPRNVNGDSIVLRIKIEEFLNDSEQISNLISQVNRLTISFINIEDFKDGLIPAYNNALDNLHDMYISEIEKGKKTQINILTDRLILHEMSNCGAGVNNITIAPNGKFYICPAFYYDEKIGRDTKLNYRKKETDRSVGDLSTGLNIKNGYLLTLGHSPLCCLCDAFHCNRCIWLNQHLTYDINTPSHQQCVMSHVERNSSMRLAVKLRTLGYDINDICEIDYIDPFDKFI